MAKTKIEWVKNPDGTQGETINPVKGLCPMACPYCYARRMYKRFKWDPEIRYERFLLNPYINMKPSRIFWGSTIELFHEKTMQYLPRIFNAVNILGQHTHIFLTKQPQNLPKVFPDNCWVGVSAVDNSMAFDASCNLASVKAKVKFISFEPLLGQIVKSTLDLLLDSKGIQWLIIGQQTPVSIKTTPKIEWIQEIVEDADKAGIPVFLKDNLKPLLPPEVPTFYGLKLIETHDNGEPEYEPILRQELPR